MKKLILSKDYAAIRKALSENPQLVNEGLPFDEENTTLAHPLHRICDLVYSGDLTDREAKKIAELFLESGADVNGFEMIIKRDTPLIAASSLHADMVAILYIEHGANIHHQGCHGGTALHWAAWCGRDIVVKRLIEKGADINKRCIDFQATPLFWAVMSYKEENDQHHQLECIRLLVQAGADKNIPNGKDKNIYSMLNNEDLELNKIIAN
ncbi:MAG TPA: ankyrin repeat domain-containing protein [Puia sp.]|jgi:ankyrin repeat protein|nr:ankyrin repeat domain-containing protein [Puia sp.]